MSKLFWLGPNHFGQVQLDFSGLIFIIWTGPKQIGPVQNDWYLTKMIWMVQNYFGQGICELEFPMNCLHYDQKLIIASTSYGGSVPIIGQRQIVVHIWIKIFLKSHLDFSASVISQQILFCIALEHFEISHPIIQFQMRVHNKFGPNVL